MNQTFILKVVLFLVFFLQFELWAQPCLSNYTYRRAVTVNNTANAFALSNHEVKIVLNTQTLITNGKLNPSGFDLRVTNAAGVLLNHYVVNQTLNTTNTEIWVKLDNVAALSSTTLYLFYGNPTASDASTGNTFTFFDDFNGSSLDNTKWNTCGSGGAVVNNGSLTLSSDGTAAGNRVVESTSSFNFPVWVEARVNSVSSGHSFLGVHTTAKDGYSLTFETVAGSPIYNVKRLSNNVGSCVNNTALAAPNNTTNSAVFASGEWSFYWASTGAQGFKAPGVVGTQTRTDATVAYANPLRVSLGNITQNASFEIDRVWVRRYLQNEPLVSLAAEQVLVANAVASSNSPVCQSETLTLTATFFPGATYNWSGPNGYSNNVQSPSINNAMPNASGTYSVTVNNGAGCAAQVATVNVDVSPTSVAGSLSGATTVCSSNNTGTITLSGNTGAVVRWESSIAANGPWSSINNTTNSLTYNNLTQSTFYRAEIKSGACSSVYTAPAHIQVNGPSVGGQLTGATVVCANQNFGTLSLTNYTGNIVKWQFSNDNIAWTDIANTSATQNYTNLSATRYYRVEVQAAPCAPVFSTTAIITVDAQPQTAFTSTTACRGVATQFTNTTTISSGSVTGFTWDFGDGNSSNVENPSHTYAQSGSYTVVFTTTSNNGCTKQITQAVNVLPAADVDFNMPNGCRGDNINFTNATSISGGASISNYLWRFGDGTTSAATNPTKSYANAGTYTVTLIAAANNACLDSLQKTITIHPRAQVAFSATNTCLGSPVVFNNNTSIANGGLTYVWDFGDGNFSSATNPSHSYAAAGTYTVKLKAISNNNCADSITQVITVHPAINAGFTTADVCFGNAVSFNNTSSIATGTLTYLWNFGDGSTSTATSPARNYAQPGTYTVTLNITSNNACTAQVQHVVNVRPKPVADFSFVNQSCVSSPVVFNNTSSIASGTLTHDWNFGDLSFSTTASPSHLYAASGTYNVQLISTSNFNCKDTVIKAVVVSPSKASGTLTGAASVCDGSNSGTLTLIGSVGQVQYWESSTTGASPWTTVNNTTTQLQYSNLNQSTWYRVIVKSGQCDTAISNVIQIEVAAPSFAGSIVGAQNVCATANSGSVVVQNRVGSVQNWLSSPNGNAPYTVIPFVGDSLSYTNLNQTTHYKAVVKSGNCQSDTSLASIITVNPTSVAGTLSGVDTVCYASNAGSVVLAGNIGNVVRWESSLTGTGPWTSINSQATTINYQNLLNTTTYRALIKSGSCDSVFNNSITVVVSPATQAGSVLGSTSVCEGSNSGFVSLTGNSGSILRWQFSEDNLNWTDINQTQSNLAYQNLDTTTWYRAIVKNGVCPTLISDSAKITVNPLPQVDFSNTTACFNTATQFSNSTSISPGNLNNANYVWDFGNNSGSTQINPNHTFPNSGTFPVSLRVTTAQGCVDSISKNVVVRNLPTVNFNAPQVCFPNATSFTSLSFIAAPSSIASHSWHFGDGNQSAAVNPTHSYAQSGNYAVKLIVTSNEGCSDSLTQTVVSNAKPQSTFSINNMCLGTAISASNNSSISNGNLNYLWRFGNGDTSSAMSPNYTYPASGSYTVILEAISNQGCRDTSNVSIDVYPQPSASFTVNNICLNDTADFSNASSVASGTLTYAWTFGDGSSDTATSPRHRYLTSGSFPVQLQVLSNNGCSASSSQFIQVYVNPVAQFSVNNVCFGDSANFVNTSSLSSGSPTYAWNFGDANTSVLSNPKHLYGSSANYTIQLKVTSPFGCADSVSHPILVSDPTQAGNILGSDSVCISNNGGNLSLNNNVGSVLYWENSSTGQLPWVPINITNTNISYSNLQGSSYFRAIVKNGACAPDTTPVAVVHVSPQTNAGFLQGSDTVCASANNGTMSLSGFVGNIQEWLLSADSGNTWQNYAGTNATNTFSNLNASQWFAVRVKSGVCPVDTSNSIQIKVDSATIAGTLIGVDTLCAGQNTGSIEVQGSTGNVTLWETRNHPTQPWVTMPATGNSLNYTNLLDTTFYRAYVQSGTCNAILTNEISLIVDAQTQGGVMLGSNAFCATVNSGVVNLVNSVGTLNRWQWSHDGVVWNDSTYTANNLAYQALDTTTWYRAVLKSGVCPERVSDSAIITIRPLPLVDFETDTACLTAATTFTNNSAISSGAISQFSWDFGNGSGSSAVNPVYTYPNFGTYTAKLIATSNFGCMDSISKVVEVNPLPVVSFTQNDVCQLSAMNFNNLSFIPLGSIASYAWDFGDANTSVLANPSHNYAAWGSYTVQLLATSAAGCSDSSSVSVMVHPHPQSSWTADTVFEPNTTTFSNNTSIVNGAQLNYNWSFGDGNTGVAVNPTHSYAQYGNYNAMLIAQSTFGCADTLIQVVVVLEQPSAVFSTQNRCIHDSVDFINQSVYNSGIANYVWDFGDGATSTDSLPTHQYAFPGTYTVQLQLFADNGGFSQTSRTVTVYSKPSVIFSALNVCDTIAVEFKNQSTINNGSMSYVWHFGDGDTSHSSQPSHIYPSDGSYQPKLIATSNFGCRDSFDVAVTVYPRPNALFSVPPVCDGEITHFNNQTSINSGSVLSQQWNFGDGRNENSILVSPNYQYLNPGQYLVTLTTISDLNCMMIFTDTAIVHETPVANFEAENVCLGEQMLFNNMFFYSGSNIIFDWNFGDGGFSNTVDPSYLYQNAGFYEVQLKVTSGNLCSDSITKIVEVYANPTPEIFVQDTSVSKGFTTQLTVNTGIAFLWSPTESLNSPTSRTVVARPMEDTQYSVEVLDSNGCSSIAYANVKVTEDYKIIASNVITPDGNGVNDRWIIDNIDTYGDCTVQIFNRWGVKVYDQAGYNNTWEGTNQAGEPLPDGAYYYVISFKGNPRQYSGAINILRNQQ